MLVSKEICKSLSDQAIIRKALVEVDYFSCLFERYENQLLRYIKNLAPVSHDEAEDILQDAFINIWKHLNEYDEQLSCSSWMYRIVHNQAVSAIRKRKSYGKDKVVAVESSGINDMPEEDGPPNDDKSAHIREILDLLPLMYKEVLALKYLENMSYEDISDILKIPDGTVATRINRAKKAFAAIAADRHLLDND
mgnify:CR=1 FL=1